MDQQLNQQSQDIVDDNLPNNLIHKTSEFEELHLKYSYSGISNASSNNQFILTTTRSFNQDWNKLNFVEVQKLFESINKTISEIQKRTLINTDLILYLLYLHKWNQDKLFDVYYQKYSQQYNQLTEKIKLYDNSIITENQKSNTCQVCCCQDTNVVQAYFCNHSYCIPCWQSYIQQNLKQSKIFFPSCMDTTCTYSKYPLILQFVKKLFPSLTQLYRKKICVNFAIVNKSVSYCPSDNCQYFCQKNVMTQQSYIECLCGVVYCFRCQKQPHQPALCQQVEKWEQITNQQKNNEQWMKKYTRKCPTCKQAVQKYIGCNHIKCLCGQQFCFNCNLAWDQTHKSSPQHCLKHKAPHSIQLQKNQTHLEELTDKIIYISRRMNKDMILIRHTQDLLTKQQPLGYLKQLFQDLKSRIHHAWINIKWSIVTLHLRQKPSIQIQIQKDSLESIKNLIETVQKIDRKIQNYSTLSHMLYLQSKQLLHLKQELFKRKQIMIKTLQVWTEAWKNIVGQC